MGAILVITLLRIEREVLQHLPLGLVSHELADRRRVVRDGEACLKIMAQRDPPRGLAAAARHRSAESAARRIIQQPLVCCQNPPVHTHTYPHASTLHV